MDIDSLIAYGSHSPLPSQTPLRAGHLTMVYEKGFLRYIRLGKIEVLRMINHAVRDHNWNTLPIEIVSEQIAKEEDSFSLSYTCEVKREGEPMLRWNCQIKGHADSSLEFEIVGTVVQDFQRNRAGFTVLHSTKDNIGRTITLRHPEGKTSEKQFPIHISPDQIFYDIQHMHIPYEGGQAVRITFEGDLFETEDQRNWLDDSYKTYCTPLRLPIPVQLTKGDSIRQLIRVEATSSGHPQEEELAVSLSLPKQAFELPYLGIGQSSEESPLSAYALSQLAKLPFTHYWVDVHLYREGWEEAWTRGLRESQALGYLPSMALFFEDTEREIQALEKVVKYSHAELYVIHVFNRFPFTTTPQTLDKVLPMLRRNFPDAHIGAGTNAYFTHLNRERFPVHEIDHLVFSINPQVHATDHATMVENLNTLPFAVATADEFTEGKDIHVGPISLKMRWNPDAVGEIVTPPGELPFHVDVRQMSMFAASWTLGMISQLVKAEVTSATFFETVGSKGLLQAQTPRYPDLLPAKAGQLYPVHWLFQQILTYKNADFWAVEVSDPLKVAGLACEQNNEMTLLLGSFSLEEMAVILPAAFQHADALVLHTDDMRTYGHSPEEIQQKALQKVSDQLVLPAFGLAKLQVRSQ